MRISEVRLYRYRLPLTAPLSWAGRQMSSREGILIAMESDTGAVGWGDVAPLPGFSAETLEEAAAHLDTLRSTLVGQSVPEAMPRRNASWAEAPASVRFGMELACADLIAEARGVPLPKVLVEDPRPTVSLNALLSGSPDEVMQDAERVATAGYRAVKLKVGRQDLHREAALVRRLADCFGTEINIRLDANRAWTVGEAQAFFQEIDSSAIDYIEEPLADPSALPALAEEGIPIALDETMRNLAIDALDRHRYARAVVLKPSLLGGFTHGLRMARRATEWGMTPVISAAYESGIGLRGLVALAASLGAADVPAGLDTYRHLRADVVDPRLPLDRPVLEVAAVMRAPMLLNTDTVAPVDESTADR